MCHKGALRRCAVLGAAVRGGGARVREAAVLLVGGRGALVPEPQLVRHRSPPRALLVALPAQRWSPYDLGAGRGEPDRVHFIPVPVLLKHSPRCVGVGGFELCFHAVVSLLVVLQAPHHHGGGAALDVQGIFFDPVLGGGLALAVQVDTVVSRPVPRSQVGHTP